MRLSKYFTVKEMQCKGAECCGNSCPMDRKFMKSMDAVREQYRYPLYITSGFRCNVHNKNIGGVDNSFHTKGLAGDVVPSGGPQDLKTLEGIAKLYFNEVIRYDDKGFVHIGNPKD